MKKSKSKITKLAPGLVGAGLVGTSVYLALALHSHHFYILLVTGIFLIFLELDRKLIRPKMYLALYPIFFAMGLFVDLLLGLTVTKFWYYNYDSFWYALLFLVTYPAVFSILLQTYLWLTNKWMALPKKLTLSSSFYKYISALLLVIVAVSAAWPKQPSSDHLAMLALFASSSLLVILLLSWATHTRQRQNILDKLINQPVRMICILFLVTYFSGLLYEILNLHAHEWVYTNLPLMTPQILGVPLIVVIGWPSLTLLSLSAYYYVASARPKLAKPRTSR